MKYVLIIALAIVLTSCGKSHDELVKEIRAKYPKGKIYSTPMSERGFAVIDSNKVIIVYANEHLIDGTVLYYIAEEQK